MPRRPGGPPGSRAGSASWRGRWRLRSAFFSIVLLGLAPAILVALAHRLWVRRKGLIGLGEKLTGAGRRFAPGQVLVHGVSLGEVNLMRPLVPRLESALGARCLLTTTTETGRSRLDGLFPDRDRAFWPFDLPWATARFLARTRPRLIILLELELWPLALCAAAARGIPVVLVNARMSASSHGGYRRAGVLLRPLFASLALVLAQNGLWAARLAGVGVRRDRLMASGSMKADMIAPAAAGEAEVLGRRLGLAVGAPLLLIASSGDGEEERVLEAWHRHPRQGWRIVICPRHPERGAEILARCAARGLSTWRSGDAAAGEREAADVIIVDEIGRLAALYRLCAAGNGIAVVGGSLGSGRGGQNMLEAAAAGCCTVVGWDVRNFPDAMALLRHADGVAEATAQSLGDVLADLAGDPGRRQRLGTCAESAWKAGRGATDRAIAALATTGVHVRSRSPCRSDARPCEDGRGAMG